MANESTALAAPSSPRYGLSIFDAHHPPSQQLLSDCVHCGFCLVTCPTYRLWGEEADSPRGRIYLMQMGLNGEAAMDDAYVGHFDRCLGCMACLTSCPSGVEYDKLIEATRSQIERRFVRDDSQRFFRSLVFATFPFPNRLRLLALPLWLYQRSGMRRLLHGSRLLALLPARLRALENLAPTVSLRAIFSPAKAPAKPAAPRLRVGMLLGCVQRAFFTEVNRATMRVLAAEGCEVIVPPGQGCCGALMTHAGEEAMAIDFARRTIDVFESAGVDVIAINSAGCGSAMKEYGHLLRDDVKYADRAKALAAKCRDVSEILAGLDPQAPRHPLSLKVAYHDACHLQHAQRITSQPRRLLQSIPGLEIMEIEDAAICCGSAGIYNLLEAEAASELGKLKAQNIVKTGARAVVSGNPGCTLQLRSSLEALGHPLPVLHWIQLLDASIHDTMPFGATPVPSPP
jgi:glycolate oxidase iron-sulfur subunit